MVPLCLDVHPVYGAIYKDGEFVQRGAVLGLSVDSREVVVAPVSGWVRLVPRSTNATVQETQYSLQVEIWQQPFHSDSTSPRSDTAN
jgi:hypothetical protein